MDPAKNALERAFEIARAGKCANVSEVKRQLAAEGYSLKDFVDLAPNDPATLIGAGSFVVRPRCCRSNLRLARLLIWLRPLSRDAISKTAYVKRHVGLFLPRPTGRRNLPRP